MWTTNETLKTTDIAVVCTALLKYFKGKKIVIMVDEPVIARGHHKDVAQVTVDVANPFVKPTCRPVAFPLAQSFPSRQVVLAYEAAELLGLV